MASNTEAWLIALLRPVLPVPHLLTAALARSRPTPEVRGQRRLPASSPARQQTARVVCLGVRHRLLHFVWLVLLRCRRSNNLRLRAVQAWQRQQHPLRGQEAGWNKWNPTFHGGVGQLRIENSEVKQTCTNVPKTGIFCIVLCTHPNPRSERARHGRSHCLGLR